MADSFINKKFKEAQKSSAAVTASVTNSDGSTYAHLKENTNWTTALDSVSCIEKPRPPEEEKEPKSPKKKKKKKPAEEVILTEDTPIPRDDRDRPGITSKTTSVGRKVKMIDHNSYYAYNPNSDFEQIEISEGQDPLRFLLGRLWTQNPPPHRLGSSANLYGVSVAFGHKIMERDEDWVTIGDSTFRPFKDPVRTVDLRSGKVIREYDRNRLPNPEGFTTKTGIVTTFSKEDFRAKKLKIFYGAMFASLPDKKKPIFSDMAEYGSITLEPTSSYYRANAEGFERLVYGGVSFNGRYRPNHLHSSKLAYSTIGSSGGLLKTISSQQGIHGMYSDHSFEYSAPISSINLEHYANISKPLYAKIDPVYNYYCKEYEQTLEIFQEAEIPEHTLPSIYTLLTEKHSDKKDFELSPHITNFLRLNPTDTRRNASGHHEKDQIKGFFIDKLNSRGEKVSETSTGASYFKKWGVTSKRMIEDFSFSAYAKTYENYMKQSFPHSEDRLYLEVKEGKPSFPMLVDLEFSTDVTAPISTAIARAKMDCKLASFLLENEEYRSPADMGNYEIVGNHKLPGYASFIENRQFIIRGNQGATSQIVSSVTPNLAHEGSLTYGRRCYDFEEWLRTLGSEEVSMDTKMFFGEAESLELANSSKIGSSDTTALLRIYLGAKVRRLIKQEGKFRELAQVFNGKLCYNEALMYKIEKYTVDPTTGQEALLGEYLLPNKSETEIIKFTDTQVKYDKPYFYRIKAINLVIGNEYFYIFPWTSSLNIFDRDERNEMRQRMINSPSCELYYCNIPSVKIIESPYYNDQKDDLIITRIVDAPPVPPNVKLDVYKGVNNKVVISINSGTGDFVTTPIKLNPNSDTEIINKIIENQFAEMKSLELNDITEEDVTKIRFRNDDPISQFEIYRTTTPPTSYESFVGKLHKVLDTRNKYSSATLIDDVSPNVVYYYTVRSIDVHGYFSNPSIVFQVELVSSEGMTYAIIRDYNFGDGIDLKEPIKEFDKFLEIRPKAEDLLLNFDKSGLDGIKNLVSHGSSNAKKVSSVFPHKASDFREGDQYTLGDHRTPDLCWGRKFKIRLTSKQSGRKLDLNVRFNYTDLVKSSDFYVNDE